MFRVGQRVKILPHSDLFMMGETRAEVIAVGRKWITIRGERSGRKFKFSVNTDALETV